jgi:hypothetical protein
MFRLQIYVSEEKTSDTSLVREIIFKAVVKCLHTWHTPIFSDLMKRSV